MLKRQRNSSTEILPSASATARTSSGASDRTCPYVQDHCVSVPPCTTLPRGGGGNGCGFSSPSPVSKKCNACQSVPMPRYRSLLSRSWLLASKSSGSSKSSKLVPKNDSAAFESL